MKQIKHMIITAAMVVVSISAYSQALIHTVDGQFYWGNDKLGNLSEKKEIGVESGRRIVRIPVSNILTVEYMEDGLQILQPDKINKVEPVAFNDDLEGFLAQGKRVYIPLASSIIQQRWGAKRLIEMLMEENYWKLVGCEDEADFILEYVFDDSGSDHAYLLFSDRTGQKVLSTQKVGASDFVPVHAGEESAEKLMKRCLKKYFFAGKVVKNAKKQKKANNQNHGSIYYIGLSQ